MLGIFILLIIGIYQTIGNTFEALSYVLAAIAFYDLMFKQTNF